jgi:hypothetical protein
LESEDGGIGDWVRARSKVIAVLIVVLVVISVIGVLSTSSFLQTDSSFNAVAIADRYHVRTGESIQFTALVYNGAIANVSWNFSDGNMSEVVDPVHAFDHPGVYTVTLVVHSKDGESSVDTVLIGSQRHDEWVNKTREGWTEYDPHTWGGPGAAVVLGPNSGHPTVDISIQMENASGSYWFRVAYYIDRYSDHEEYHIIHSENVTLYGGDYTFTHTVYPSEIKSNVSTCDHSDMFASALMYDGSVDGFVFNLTARFPLSKPRALD